MTSIKSYTIFVLALVFISCNTYKNVPYFQDQTENLTEKINNFTPLTIQPQDILGINVTSLNPQSSDIYNTNLTRVNGNNFDINPTNPIVGYLVNQEGNIQLPSIGKISVAGLTISQAQQLVLKKVSPTLKDAGVTVRLINFKISILGDVEHPGVYPITNERVTVTEGLAFGGDLNITAVRTNIVLIRESDGQRKYFHIDLTSKKIFDSPYYYLKNNDVLYVQPGKLKYSQINQKGFQVGTLILSAFTVIAIVFSTLHK